MQRFDADPDADMAVITGNGRVFSSGADVQQRQLRSRERFTRLGASHYLALLNFRSGVSFAVEVALTGRFFTAEEAFEAKIINRDSRQHRGQTAIQCAAC